MVVFSTFASLCKNQYLEFLYFTEPGKSMTYSRVREQVDAEPRHSQLAAAVSCFSLRKAK